MAGNVTLRIMRLRALIDHPGTGDGERAAAQRMLDRTLTASRSPRHSGDRTYGARHHRVGRHSNLSRIAEMIREDIAFARVVFAPSTQPSRPAVHDPIADAPADVTCRVSRPVTFRDAAICTFARCLMVWPPRFVSMLWHFFRNISKRACPAVVSAGDHTHLRLQDRPVDDDREQERDFSRLGGPGSTSLVAR